MTYFFVLLPRALEGYFDVTVFVSFLDYLALILKLMLNVVIKSSRSFFFFQAQLALITKFVNAAHYCCEIRNFATCLQIIDALEMFVVRHLPV